MFKLGIMLQLSVNARFFIIMSSMNALCEICRECAEKELYCECIFWQCY